MYVAGKLQDMLLLIPMRTWQQQHVHPAVTMTVHIFCVYHIILSKLSLYVLKWYCKDLLKNFYNNDKMD